MRRYDVFLYAQYANTMRDGAAQARRGDGFGDTSEQPPPADGQATGRVYSGERLTTAMNDIRAVPA